MVKRQAHKSNHGGTPESKEARSPQGKPPPGRVYIVQMPNVAQNRCWNMPLIGRAPRPRRPPRPPCLFFLPRGFLKSPKRRKIHPRAKKMDKGGAGAQKCVKKSRGVHPPVSCPPVSQISTQKPISLRPSNFVSTPVRAFVLISISREAHFGGRPPVRVFQKRAGVLRQSQKKGAPS